MTQASGSKGLVMWKPEKTFGVPDFATVGGGASTTLAAPSAPGATSIEVTSALGIAAGDVLAVGGSDSVEFVQVDGSYASGTTVALDPLTPLNFHHAAGEAVVESAPSGLKKLGALVAFSPSGGMGRTESAVITSSRALEIVRTGNHEVRGTLTLETSIESMGIVLLHALADDYAASGTAVSGGANTTLNEPSGVSAGATGFDVADATGIGSGDYLQLGTGDGAEVVKVSSVSVNTVTLDPSTPLRKAHADGTAVVEVTSPYTYVIKRGSLPAGLTLVLHFSDVDSLALYRGVKIDTLSLEVTPGAIPTLRAEFVAKAVQVLQKNLFGTPPDVPHTPYAAWEGVVEEGGAPMSTVQSLSLSIRNNLRGGSFGIGSPFIASAADGEGRAGGSLTYHYFDASLIKKAVFETESSLKVRFVYSGDTDHELEFHLPRVRYSGTHHPGLPDRGPITDTREFDALRDATEDTDVKVTFKTTEAALL